MRKHCKLIKILISVAPSNDAAFTRGSNASRSRDHNVNFTDASQGFLLNQKLIFEFDEIHCDCQCAQYTRTLVVRITRDHVPRLESPPAEHLVVESGPSQDEVTRIISKEAYSFLVKKVVGVNRYDGTQLASNSPCENRFTHGKFPSPWNDGNQWMAWAVFDGHAGWQTADLLKKQLLSFVRYSLSLVKSPSNEESISEELVQRAIIKGFVNLDDSIIKTALDTSQSKEPLQDKVKKLAPAYAGSCALLSVYDSVTSTLHVACTGDSRAVLGQKMPDGKWETIPL